MYRQLWIVNWTIDQDDGAVLHGSAGAYTSKGAAVVAALKSIDANWIQGDWGKYDEAEVKKLRILVREEKYQEALDFWKNEFNSSYSVEIEEATAIDGPALMSIDEMSFVIDERAGYIVGGASVCEECLHDAENTGDQTEHSPGEEYVCSRCEELYFNI